MMFFSLLFHVHNEAYVLWLNEGGREMIKIKTKDKTSQMGNKLASESTCVELENNYQLFHGENNISKTFQTNIYDHIGASAGNTTVTYHNNKW